MPAKTSLFNALTGLRHKVANYPGVTIERKEGWWCIDPTGPAVHVIDLPGYIAWKQHRLTKRSRAMFF
jgi:Fe2+ transport system protein B